MIAEVVSIVHERLAQRYNLIGCEISVLKLSTPNSGKGPFSKVIFLLFKDKSSMPFACVKTVRSQEDNATIEDAFQRLSLTQTLLKGSEFSGLFPEPLFLTTNIDGVAWSAETACIGRRANRVDYQQIYQVYTAEQVYLQNNRAEVSDIDELIRQQLDRLELSAPQLTSVRAFIDQQISTTSGSLPVIPQHGDFTLDNIFINSRGVQIYDCERFGLVNIAGYDIFQLLTRWIKHDPSINLSDKLGQHFQQLGHPAVPLEKAIFLFVLIEFWLKKLSLTEALTAESLIRRYQSLIA